MATISKGQKRVKTAALAKAIRLNALIDNNKHMFKQGAKFTMKDLCKLFKITPITSTDYKEQHKFRLSLVQHYVDLNNLLALRGLQVKSKNYYENYEVTTLNKITSIVDSYTVKSEIMMKAGERLEKGARIYKSKWHTLGPREIKRVSVWINNSINYTI